MQPMPYLFIWMLIHTTEASIPIVVNAGPYQQDGDWKSEGQCSFTLDRTYVIGDIEMEIVSNFPVLSSTLTIWNMNKVSETGYTYCLSSKYEQHAGLIDVIFHLTNPQQITLQGHCNSNVEPQVESSTSKSTEVIYITTDQITVKSFTTSESTSIYTTLVGSSSSESSTVESSSSESSTVESSSSESSTVESSPSVISTVESSSFETSTVEASSTESSQTSVSSTSANGASGSLNESGCACPCSVIGREANVNFSKEIVAEKIQKLEEELKINKDQTSSAQRKKTSAKDDRPSAKAIGTVGIVVLCITFGIILMFDLDNAIKFVNKLKNRNN